MAQTKTRSKKKTAVNVLNVAYVWDMSGSMGIVEDATKEGTLQYLLDLQKEEEKLVAESGADIYTRISLTVFDTVFEQWVVHEPIAEIDARKLVANYRHRGNTALYDAIANTIVELEERLKKDSREDEKCLVIVMTDGQENSSKEYGPPNGKQRIFDLIENYQARGNWTFVYLGANVNAYAEAAGIGIPQGNAAFYAATPDSVQAVAASTQHVTSTRRSDTRGQTVTAFADAGQSQDYRDVKKAESTSDWSQSATDATKKAR